MRDHNRQVPEEILREVFQVQTGIGGKSWNDVTRDGALEELLKLRQDIVALRQEYAAAIRALRSLSAECKGQTPAYWCSNIEGCEQVLATARAQAVPTVGEEAT